LKVLRLLGGHDGLANGPQRQRRQLEVRPGEGNADNRNGETDRRNHVPEPQPPPGEHEPEHITDRTERTCAQILLPFQLISPHRDAPERPQGVAGDVERSTRPRQTNDRNDHQHGRYQPSDSHPEAAGENPKDIQ
jgi:hypothetical protein